MVTSIILGNGHAPGGATTNYPCSSIAPRQEGAPRTENYISHMVADNNEHCARLERELASYQAITRRLDAYTQQLETEARELRCEAGLGQAILDALPDPMLVTDMNGRVLRRNRTAAWLFALPEEAAACATAISCQKCFGEECPLRHDLAPGERQVQITGPDGVRYTFALSAVPLPAERVLLLHFRDMTELAALWDKDGS